MDSLINQTYSYLEIIAVNDGSPDNCLSILKEYETKDKRVVVYNRENGGANSARNFALSKAHGHWISFVDSDDWLDIHYFEELMKYADSTNQLICGGFRINENGPSYSIPKSTFSSNTIESIELLYGTYFGMIYNVWGKVFRKEIITTNNLYFKSYLRHDGIFLLEYINHINKISIISSSSYLHYNTENTNSLTHRIYGIEKMMLDLYRYYNSFAKLIESDYSNYDRYMRIINMDKTHSFCEILHETYILPYKQKLYWYRRMIEQLPKFTLSQYLNKGIHRRLKWAFKLRSPRLVYCIVKLHLFKLKLQTIIRY
jgi:glycosyltransferase involved in cell wall biosynthesis